MVSCYSSYQDHINGLFVSLLSTLVAGGRLTIDTQGEIAVGRSNVMREYLKNPNATRDSFTPQGWLRTGDLGHIGNGGYIFVTGRLKAPIIKGGAPVDDHATGRHSRIFATRMRLRVSMIAYASHNVVYSTS